MRNITIDELRERLDNLRNGSRSGVITFKAENGVRKSDGDFWENHCSIIYFHEIGILWAGYLMWNNTYCNIASDRCVSGLLDGYLKETGGTESDISETGWTETDYTEKCYIDRIWDMSHDWDECADLDADDFDGEYGSYNVCCVKNFKTFDAFRLCGQTSVSDDIKAFRKLIDTDGTFEVVGKDGKTHRFAVTRNDESREFSDYDTTYSLNLVSDETYMDETEGPIPVRVCRCLLHALELGTIYAKSRTFIYVNFVEQ